MEKDIAKDVDKSSPKFAENDKTNPTPFQKELFGTKTERTDNQNENLVQQFEPHGRPGGGGPAPRPEPPRPQPRPEPPRPQPRPEPPRPQPRPEPPHPQPRPEPPRPQPRPEPPHPQPRPEPPHPQPPRPEPPRPQPPRPEPPHPQPPRPEPPHPQPPKPEPPHPQPPRPEPPHPQPPRPEPPHPQPPKPEPPHPQPPRPEPPHPQPPRPEPPHPQPPRPEPPHPQPPRPEPPHPQPPRPEPPHPQPPRPEPPHPQPPRPEPPHPHPPKPPRPEPPRPQPHPPRPEPGPGPHPPRPEPGPGPHPPRPEPGPGPHPPRPEPGPGPHPPRPEPPRPEPPREHPHPPVPTGHHPYHDGDFYRPHGEHWGWQDRDRFQRGWDPWFFQQSPNYDRWNGTINAESRQIARLIESGNTAAAMVLLNAELYDLRYDRYAQNELLREVADRVRRDQSGAYLNLDRWNPNNGSWDTVEVVPPPPPPQPLPPPDQPPPPAPVPDQPIPVPKYDEDPWMQLEGTVISSLMDAGDPNAAAKRLRSDLYSLRGNLDAQNVLLSIIDNADRKGAGTDLKLGDWDPNTGTYSSIEVLPALTDPGDGTQISTYAAPDAAQPDDVIDTTKSNTDTDPFQHQEIAVIAAFLDTGDTQAAATRLATCLQALKGDMEAQNQVLSQVSASRQDDSASQLKLGDWDAEKGTYSSIEVLPAGSDPGTGISIHTYPGDEVKPDPSKKPDGGTQNDPDKQNNQN